MSIVQTNKCRALIQQGKRAGEKCERESKENGYCIYHQRNYQYEQLINQEKKLCGMFFRGCNNELNQDDLTNNYKNCNNCRGKKSGKTFNCKYTGCNYKIMNKDQQYCKKHIRQLLRDKEISEDIKYCDINRGCFNKIIDGTKCEECKMKERIEIGNQIEILRQKHSIVLNTINTYNINQENTLITVSELWRSIQRGAYYRELLFTITESDFEKLAIQPCYYCGFYSNIRLNGIDRIDNNKGYILDNCITCCKMCNIIKNIQHPNEFLDKVDTIVNYIHNKENIDDTLINKWSSYITSRENINYKQYIYLSKRRNITIELTEKEYNEIIEKECYLCGIKNSKKHQNGIDRVDNHIRTYNIENSKTCCGHCNLMKGIYPYFDFIEKCKQINNHKCNRHIFDDVSKYDNTRCRNEYYTAEDIFIFMTQGRYIQFLEWCKEKEKTPEFITSMNDINNSRNLSLKNKECVISEIKNELEKERKRQYNNEMTELDDKKNLHSATVYSYLISGKKDIFIYWYNKHHKKSTLFDEKFNSLIESLPSLTKNDGINACQKFMYDEKNRRNSQLRRESSKKTIKYNTSLQNDIIPINSPKQNLPRKQPFIAQYNDIDNTIQLKEHINTIITPPTIEIPTLEEKIKIIQNLTGYEKKEIKDIVQWKVKQIYEAISTDSENKYKLFCEQNNDISKIPTWETDWVSFVLSVKGNSQKDSEQIIRKFVENLRRIRHNELCNSKKDILDREDRQQWPATSVAKAFLDGKIDNFKKFTELQTGDDPDDSVWQKRWNSFIKSLDENKDNEKQLKTLCTKFLTAQRTKRYRKKEKE
jgi:hypothetical protein